MSQEGGISCETKIRICVVGFTLDSQVRGMGNLCSGLWSVIVLVIVMGTF